MERRKFRGSLKICDYAQELHDALDNMPGWPEEVRKMQRDWAVEGAEIKFGLADSEEELEVYTTRADTLMGCTYMAAGHPLAVEAAEKDEKIAAFVEECRPVVPPKSCWKAWTSAVCI